MNISFVTSNTANSDLTNRSVFVALTQDEDGSWIASDVQTTVYGHGDTLLEALVDYWAALRSTLRIIEDNPSSARLLAEAKIIRWMLGVAA